VSEEKPVLTRLEDGALWVTLNRPAKLNTLTPEMHSLITEAVEKAGADPAVRCIVVTGAGDRAFCAGADIGVFAPLTPKEAKEFSRAGHRTIKAIIASPKPVVAAVNGHALGGGCELAAACDIRVAVDKARFGQPEVNLGVIPGWGGTQVLAGIIGNAKARELVLTGALLTAPEAQQAGLVSKVAPPEKFMDEVKAVTATLVNGPPLALAAAKKLMSAKALEAGLEAEADEFSKLFASADMKEGVAAFTGKRKPAFRGE
jgi:enoyl-CoA hydratase